MLISSDVAQNKVSILEQFRELFCRYKKGYHCKSRNHFV